MKDFKSSCTDICASLVYVFSPVHFEHRCNCYANTFLSTTESMFMHVFENAHNFKMCTWFLMQFSHQSGSQLLEMYSVLTKGLPTPLLVSLWHPVFCRERRTPLSFSFLPLYHSPVIILFVCCWCIFASCSECGMTPMERLCCWPLMLSFFCMHFLILLQKVSFTVYRLSSNEYITQRSVSSTPSGDGIIV